MTVGISTTWGCGGDPQSLPQADQVDQAVTEETPASASADSSEVAASPQKLSSAHLPNAYRVHRKVISGGQPAREAAFRELQDLGVKTVISVDGAQPDVELARKYGLRYVHLPHGYDGIPEQQVQSLAKAVRDLEGPIYIHCHHGRHRSPTAAAVACVSVGLIEPSSSLAILKAAGTSANYRGLYQSAEAARRIDDAVLNALQVEFSEIATLPPLAEAMVAIEHTQDRLKQVAAAGWKSPADHPDLEPAHEALLLREQFTEMLRTDVVASKPAAFRELLQDSETGGEELEGALRGWLAAGSVAPVPAQIGLAFDRIAQNCVTCHRQFRDVPLGEKRP